MREREHVVAMTEDDLHRLAAALYERWKFYDSGPDGLGRCYDAAQTLLERHERSGAKSKGA